MCSNGKCNVLANVSLSPSTWFLHLSVAFNQWSCISCSHRGHKTWNGKKVSRQVLTYFNFECCIFRMQRHARDTGKDVWREKDISLAGLHRMCFCILLCYFSVVFLGKQALMVKQFPWNEFLQSGMSGTWWQSEADSTYLDVSVGQLAWECVEACRSAWWVCVWH